MPFSSPTFIFLLLPLTLAAFFVLPRPLRTSLLITASLVFYAWGEKQLVSVLAISIVLNWALALVVERTGHERRRRAVLVVAAALNIGALLYFKYTNFVVANVSAVLQHFGRAPLDVTPVHLPIAVSFITFEALSYVVDVYRRDTRAARNPLHVALFISFFPHLIAGPILRFRDVAGALARPAPTLDQIDRGVSRFVLGLAKKMLVANPLGHVADQVFALAPGQLGAGTAWLGVVCYALQIYFDFSGYSDMAVGLGCLFGFSLPENFRLPYAAESIRDFWRRWNITLSTWFRDYLFIPLGGSRRGPARTSVNLLVVFLLCGLWHGARWTFVAWGAFHGAFLVLERLPFGRLVARAPRPLRHAYALLVVLVGWVFFRSESLPQAWHYLHALAGAGPGQGPRVVEYLSIEVQLALGVGVLLSTVPWHEFVQGSQAWQRELVQRAWRLAGAAAQLALFVLSLVYVAAGTHSPFIYFRF